MMRCTGADTSPGFTDGTETFPGSTISDLSGVEGGYKKTQPYKPKDQHTNTIIKDASEHNNTIVYKNIEHK
jgi:hypothetical protein